MPQIEFQCRLRRSHQFMLDAAFRADQQITALFGASGAGKTTILSMIAGLTRPDEGLIRLNDATLFDGHVDVAPEHRGVGYVPQEHLLFPHLSVRDNLLYGTRRRPTRKIDLHRLAGVLEIADLLERRPASLSGGQRQRVALGRAILRGPKLLLMDEPLAAVDAPTRQRILNYLERAAHEWDITTLFVSHDQTDVRRFAQGVVVIDAGRAVAAGPVADTLDHAVLSPAIDVHGPVNFLRLERLETVGDHLRGWIGDQSLSFSGAPSTSGSAYVRFLPRDVMLSIGDISGISARNHLHGTVVEIADLPGRVFVAIDVGQRLWAEITHEALRELNLTSGAPVTCHVKSSAITLLQ